MKRARMILAPAGAVIVIALWWFHLWEPAMTQELRIDAASVLVTTLGAIAVSAGLYFTKRTIDVSREGQITERFTRAIDQLGSKRLEIRLGGIYALERIARDSSRDQGPIMEVLTTYVRQHAAWTEPIDAPVAVETATAPECPPDVQAVMTVLGRRVHRVPG